MKSVKLRVGVVCGGCSLEHDISLRSAKFIEQSINRDLFDIVILWLDKSGDWYVIKSLDYNFFSYRAHNNIERFLQKYSKKIKFYFDDVIKLDVIFPIMHGKLGEDGTLQGFLRVVKLPCVGSGVIGSAICMNKNMTKRLLKSFGLPVVPFKTFLFNEQLDINFYNLVDRFGLPLFIKPVDQGSSIGVSKVNDINGFNKAVNLSFSYSTEIIVEPFILGRELECAVLGNWNPKASLCGEIVLKNNDFYTYKNKYTHNSARIVIPAVLNGNDSNKIRYMAVQAFQVLRCFGMARIDFFLTKENQIFINEVNTLPGFTDTSMYPKLWESTGLDVKQLITVLIQLALERYRHN